MNIIWIEDLADEFLARQLFKPIIEPNKENFISEWMAEHGHQRFSSKLLEEYFEGNNSEHRVTLCNSVSDYNDLFSLPDISRKVDIFVIDINLTSEGNSGKPLVAPDGYRTADFPFERAGIYIYNDLVARRFPRERICLVTAESPTISDYQKICRDQLIEPPQSFHKGETTAFGYPQFHEWLQKHAVDDYYLRFRRGALNGIAWVRELIRMKSSDGLHFRGYLDPKQREHFTENDAEDYLNGLEALLPAAVENKNEESAVLRTFLRALAHEWEDRAKPSNKRHIPLAMVTANVMKLARNCLSHGRLLDSTKPDDLAIFFIFGFRAMFGNPSEELRSYEQDLLNFFDLSPIDIFTVNEKLKDVNDTLRKHLDECVKEGRLSLFLEKNKEGKRKPRVMRNQFSLNEDGGARPLAYSEVVKELSMAANPLDLPFPKLILNTFWLDLLERDNLQFLLTPKPDDKWAIDFHHHVFAHYFCN